MSHPLDRLPNTTHPNPILHTAATHLPTSTCTLCNQRVNTLADLRPPAAQACPQGADSAAAGRSRCGRRCRQRQQQQIRHGPLLPRAPAEPDCCGAVGGRMQRVHCVKGRQHSAVGPGDHEAHASRQVRSYLSFGGVRCLSWAHATRGIVAEPVCLSRWIVGSQLFVDPQPSAHLLFVYPPAIALTHPHPHPRPHTPTHSTCEHAGPAARQRRQQARLQTG